MTTTIAGTSGTQALTERQTRRMQQLPGHEVVSVRGGVALVREPDGRMSRIQPSGRMVASIRVDRVQSYLHVRG
ncbi:MAG: hypothetical protein ACHP93_00535 [Solirubrobacterales bacterium]